MKIYVEDKNGVAEVAYASQLNYYNEDVDRVCWLEEDEEIEILIIYGQEVNWDYLSKRLNEPSLSGR